MTINYNCTGERHKELVHTIAEILECDSKYLGMPTQAYSVGFYTVSKTGELIFDDSEEVEQLISESGLFGVIRHLLRIRLH